MDVVEKMTWNILKHHCGNYGYDSFLTAEEIQQELKCRKVVATLIQIEAACKMLIGKRGMIIRKKGGYMIKKPWAFTTKSFPPGPGPKGGMRR